MTELMATTERKWMTAGDAARTLGVSVQTLRQWADEGKVRVFRTLGGHRRFLPRDIEGLSSTFEQDPAGNGAHATPAAPAAPVVVEAPAAPRQTRRVLVVDDYPATRSLLRVNLEAEGCVVEEAADGAGALDRAAATAFDLVLLDVNMPGPDGWEVLGRLGEVSARGHVPVIMFSASALDESERARAAGAVDYVTKPFDVESLIDRVRSVLA